jgi:chloramphenicol 3-O-phosphotransferase
MRAAHSGGYLVVVYGPPLSGKTTLAWELARTLIGKSAVVSIDSLLEASIAVPAEDAGAELEMAHTQARLLVANYMKNLYSVVVEGPYFFERGGAVHRLEQEIDQTLVLMRNMTSRSLLVRLTAGEAELAARARNTGREHELEAALRIDSMYKLRHGPLSMSFDTTEADPAETAARVRERLMAESFT